jgi:mitochondrial fission protein ELM1
MLKANSIKLIGGHGPVLPGSLPPVPNPWFLILPGGDVKQFRPSGAVLKTAAQKVQDAANRAGDSVVISTSGRTPETMLSATMDGLTKTPVRLSFREYLLVPRIRVVVAAEEIGDGKVERQLQIAP